ncbi:MAG TPA: glycosyltransferase 87 family protein [Pseudonocardiaceae bacterium]|nr:glycosyltransferase 87 family protein [Pseudonocardiaceae bacterium]
MSGQVRELRSGGRVIAAVVLAAINVVVVAIVLNSPWSSRPLDIGGYRLDLDVYRIGSTVWRHGGDLYGWIPPVHIGPRSLYMLFTYPPVSAILLAPLSLVSFATASVLISVLTVATLLLVVVLAVRGLGLFTSRWRGWLLVGAVFPVALWFEPVRETLGFGQINVLLMALVALDCLGGGRRWPRGVLVGLAAAIKLTPAVFIVWFLVRKDWRSALRAGVSFCVVTGITFVIDPHDSLRYWTSAVFDPGRIGQPGSADNQSIMGTLARFGLGNAPRELLWLGLVAGVLWLTVLGVRRVVEAGHVVLGLSLVGLAGLLCSPVSWSHHWVWAVPLLLSLTVLSARTRSWPVMLLTGAGLVVFLLPRADLFVYFGVAVLVAAMFVPLRRPTELRFVDQPPMSHDEFRAMNRFPALDGLRAISALLVVLFHNQGPSILQGWIGVHVFFVLSGFLITTLMLREEPRTGRVNLGNFYVRRAFRILPVYFLVLFVTAGALLVGGQFPHNPLGRQFPLYLVFLNEFGDGGSFGQSWTLGIEQKFYLVWPLLAFSTIIFRRRATPGRRTTLTVALMTLALAGIPFTLGGNPLGWPEDYFVLLAGCLLALLMHHRRGFRLVRPLTRPWVATVVAGLFVAAQLSVHTVSTYLDHHRLVSAMPGYVAVVPLYAIAVVLLLPAIVAPGPPRWLLSRKPMVFLGERSYSIYLVQVIAQTMVLFVLPMVTGLARGIAVAAVAVLLAHACYGWLELPMVSRGRRIIARRAEVLAPAPARATVTR